MNRKRLRELRQVAARAAKAAWRSTGRPGGRHFEPSRDLDGMAERDRIDAQYPGPLS
jgi:hypothetical protein